MRDTYHEALDGVTDQLVVMIRTVGSMIDRASSALLEVDLGKAESVIAQDEDVDHLELELEERCTELLALQQPVATDLRIVTGALRMSSTIERMGDLARHIAKIARMRYPESAVPDQVRPIFIEMAQEASLMASAGRRRHRRPEPRLALEIEQLDDRMDDLHVQLLQTLLSDWPGTVDQAVDLTLVSRFYERFADHAVSMARRIVLHDDRHQVRRAREALAAALGGHGGDGVSGSVRVEVLPAADGRHEVGVQRVDQRDAGRDVEPGDGLVGDAVEVLHERPQRVPVRGDEDGRTRTKVRDDPVVPVRQHPVDDIGEALGLAAGAPAAAGVARVRSAWLHSEPSSIGGGGTSYDRRQSMNCSSPYASSVAALSLPCSAP